MSCIIGKLKKSSPTQSRLGTPYYRNSHFNSKSSNPAQLNQGKAYGITGIVTSMINSAIQPNSLKVRHKAIQPNSIKVRLTVLQE